MINFILLVMLLLISMVLLNCRNIPLVIHFLNLLQLLHPQVLLIIIIARFLCKLLLPSVPNDYSFKDPFSFVPQIKNINLSRKHFSYKVTSLFTTIPLQETIDIAKNLIFNHNPNLNITRKEHKKLFLLVTSQTHFIFNSKYYSQIDGVAMGSPLAPVLANIFMGF